MSRPGKIFAVLAAACALTAAAGGVGVWFAVRASLPQLDGEIALPGLAAETTAERDRLGAVTIRGDSQADVIRVLGFVHAQDRFFQMDLLRRRASGRLAELFGRLALPSDRESRLHRFGATAADRVAALPPDEQTLLETYAEGVNAGLEALRARPFEYLLLQAEPEPWRPEDSILAGLTMFLDLRTDPGGRLESDLGVLFDLLPAEAFAFLAPQGTEWDAPLEGGPFATPPVPDPNVLNLRSQPGQSARLPLGRLAEAPPPAGSNNWAVAGAHTASGRALVANDMHLTLRVPHVWHRASLAWEESGGRAVRVTGVTLPGVPGVIAGSNGHVAWGLTNSFQDTSDLVVIEPAGGETERYRTPDGPRPFERYAETIAVRGGEPDVAAYRWTIWGPVADRDHQGRERALRWIAHDVEAINLRLFQTAGAVNVEEALAIAAASGIPPQNFVAGDAEGNIGWTIAGAIPLRTGFDGRTPVSWADGSRRWSGYAGPLERPRVVNPPSGRIWTANNRIAGGDGLALLGDGHYALGARAKQIRDGLMALGQASEEDMLAIQLDDRALLLESWRELLLDVLNGSRAHGGAALSDAREIVSGGWTGRASVDSAAYWLTREFRLAAAELALEAFSVEPRKADPRFRLIAFRQWEGPVWRLVSERPAWLLNSAFGSWEELLLAAAYESLRRVTADAPPGAGLHERTWGARNRLEMKHPVSFALPRLARWLDMPAEPLPGDSDMPRYQRPSYGASERMAVSPGAEDRGLFHMPGGQSGHPLSPFYRAGHAAWVHGDRSPFLPQEAVYQLVFRPAD